MPSPRNRARTLAHRALGAAGLDVVGLDGRTWVVRRADDRRRTVRQVGPDWLRAHVVFGRGMARRRMNAFQNGMGEFLREQHVGWTLRRLGITCVLDVGANTGQYARALRRTGYTGRIVSYEPVAHLAEQLRSAAADDPEWHVRTCATGEEDTTSEIRVTPGSGAMSSLLSASDFGEQWSRRLQESRPETIAVRRLDGLLDDAVAGLSRPRVFLKMDTQGYDLPTLRGLGDRGREVLGLQSEVSCLPIYDRMPRYPEQLAEYESWGFELSGVFPVSRERDTLRLIELDAVMVRADEVTPQPG